MNDHLPKIYAYVDEAANLADKNRFFIIGIVSTQSKKELRQILKRARKVTLGRGKRQIPEIKSSRVARRVVTYIIKKLAQKEVAIYAWVVDKESRRVEDTPQNYGLVLGHTLKYGFNLANWDKVWVDEKYNKERDKRKLEQTLRKILGDSIIGQDKVVFAKSEKEPGLGLADFVAGAFYTAYNQGDHKLVDLLRSKIVVEEKILWREIRTRASLGTLHPSEVKRKQKATAPRGSVAPR